MAAIEGISRFQLAYPAYERKIQTYSRIHFRSIPGYEQPDLEVELQEVLWLACQKYDPNRGATFNTCFWEFVKRRVIDLKKSAFRQKRLADLNTETLNGDTVRRVVEEMTKVGSAEDEALARIAVVERFRSGAKIA